MATFTIKKNDTSPALEYTLSPAVDLTGASVRFHMRSRGGALKVDAAASITTPTPGIVQYDFLAVDTDTVGTYEAEFEVTYADNTIETFPNSGYLIVNISDDIA